VDSRLLRREIQESMDMTEEELEAAATQLLQQQQQQRPTPAAADLNPTTNRYMEHLGGYGMHEMRDYNKYSASATDRRNGGGTLTVGSSEYSRDYSTDETDDMVYVTTL
jgi:hypothetical protein